MALLSMLERSSLRKSIQSLGWSGRRVKRPVILAIAGVGLLFLCGGCSVLILDDLSQGDEPFEIPLGSTRDDVEAQLGKPVTVTPLPDGGLVAIYEYSLPIPEAWGANEVLDIHLAFAARGFPLSLGLETIFVPYALYKAATAPLGEVTFTYGADGRLLYIGLPPCDDLDEDCID